MLAGEERQFCSPRCRLRHYDRTRRPKRTGERPRTIHAGGHRLRELSEGSPKKPRHSLPQSRAECVNGPRPCPYVSCRHHLYLDISKRTGRVKLNFPELEVWEMGTSCALDMADSGDSTLDEVGKHMNLTRERVRQVEETALRKLRNRRLIDWFGER